MATPDVSVIIPVHNRADLLPRTLASVAAQVDAPRFEVIVVDDVSTDDSARVAAEAGARVLSHATNQGPGVARNTGIEAAAGTWCAFVDSDDLWGKNHLRTMWQARHGVDLVGTCGLSVTDQDGRQALRVINSPFPWPFTARQPAHILRPFNMLNTSATMVRTEVLRTLGGFRQLRWSEDLDLWLRVLHDHPGRVLPAITVGIRTHAGQTSSINRDHMRTSLVDAVRSAELESGMPADVGRRLEAVAWWDDCRATGTRPPVGDLLSRLHLILPLIAGRFAVRHRWKVPASGATEIRAMLIAAQATGAVG